jgi:hypothetical protein
MANTTYMLSSEPSLFTSGPINSERNKDATFDTYSKSNSLMQLGTVTKCLIVRGEELHDKRIKIDVYSKINQCDQVNLDLCKNLNSVH